MSKRKHAVGRMKEIFQQYNELKREVATESPNARTRTLVQRFQRSALRELETLVERL